MEQNVRVCAACHSVEPDRNLTGPSLANLWGRKAGSLPSFERYSDALKASGVIWDDRSLDAWLTDPARMVPHNEMPFRGSRTHAFARICWHSSRRPPSRGLCRSEPPKTA
jgi:cytochrome c